MKLELAPVSFTAEGARDARRAWPVRESLLLRCSDASGAYGVGEASPLPGYSPDRLEQVDAALRSLEPSQVAEALEQSSPRGALLALAALLPRELPSARLALETAGLDLLGRRRGAPAPALLGALPGARRKLSALLGAAGAPRLLDHAERALAAGYDHVKVKLGEKGALSRELDAISALRRALGPHVGLRLDANGALAAPEVEQAWRVLEPLGIELFEEPGALSEDALGSLPLALDESLQGLTPADVAALLRRRPVRGLVLKPTALGGLSHCFDLAEVAREAGVSVVVSHCFDGPYAFASASALALALPESAPHGLAPHPALDAWHSRPFPIERGRLTSWSEPGLGAVARREFP